MKTFIALVKRNVKIFFKDKGAFFSSLITPLILLVLYATFLAKIYRDSFVSSLKGYHVANSLIDGAVAGQLFSSLLAVCCVTVAFCSNMISVQDKVTGAANDLLVSPVKRSAAAVSYSVAAFISTLIVTLTATAVSLIYVAAVGWYMSFTDVLLVILDVILLSAFGTLLSSVITAFLSSQGQVQAVGTIVSAGYGFICGAYMPISQFGDGLQTALGFLPGTYVKRRIFGNELPARSNKRNKRRHRLQYLLFRKQSRNMGRVSGANRVDSSSYRFIYIDIRFKKT